MHSTHLTAATRVRFGGPFFIAISSQQKRIQTMAQVFSKKNMFAGQISYFGFFKIAWWSAIFFS